MNSIGLKTEIESPGRVHLHQPNNEYYDNYEPRVIQRDPETSTSGNLNRNILIGVGALGVGLVALSMFRSNRNRD